ncbi:MAG: RagB/SusD family nutrient uptake outer membrane protein [Odoribacter splanchnicus]
MRHIIILMVSLFFISCENWLDVSPKSDIKVEDLFSTQEGFEDAVMGVYSLMTLPDVYGANLSFGYADVLADYYTVGTKSAFYEASKYNYREAGEEGRLSSIWSLMYKGIANLNSILKHVDERQEVFGENDFYLYKGEVLALRAMLHFDLLRLFAPSMKVGENEKAIPYMDSYTHLVQPRLSVREVLDGVIRDLNEARDLMRPYDSFGPRYAEDEAEDTPASVDGYKSRMRYYSATALLARVYLYAGETEKALTVAKEIIGEADGEMIPIFRMASNADVSDPLFEEEIVFALSKNNLADEIDAYFSDVAAATATDEGSRYLRMRLTSKDKIYRSQNAADIEFREMWFRQAGNDKNYVTLSKYMSAGHICLLRVSELFLIAAECAPSNADRLKYMNRYRVHRGLTELGEMGDAVHEEYRKEFIGEGQLFFYYKRKNKSKIGPNDKTIVPEDVYVMPRPVAEDELGSN